MAPVPAAAPPSPAGLPVASALPAAPASLMGRSGAAPLPASVQPPLLAVARRNGWRQAGSRASRAGCGRRKLVRSAGAGSALAGCPAALARWAGAPAGSAGAASSSDASSSTGAGGSAGRGGLAGLAAAAAGLADGAQAACCSCAGGAAGLLLLPASAPPATCQGRRAACPGWQGRAGCLACTARLTVLAWGGADRGRRCQDGRGRRSATPRSNARSSAVRRACSDAHIAFSACPGDCSSRRKLTRRRTRLSSSSTSCCCRCSRCCSVCCSCCCGCCCHSCPRC